MLDARVYLQFRVAVYRFRLHAKSCLLGAWRHVSSINIPELRPMKVNGRNGGRAAIVK